MQEHFPVIRNDCLPVVVKNNNGDKPFKAHVNYVTGLIVYTILRKSILSKIAYACQKCGMNQEEVNKTIHGYLESY